MAKDYYGILGVQKDATEDDIKKAFRKLAQKYHPDKKGGDEAKFKEASEAYAVLSDKKRRAEYDAYGRSFAGFGGQGGQGFGDFDFAGFARGFDGFSAGNGSSFGGEFDLGDIFGEFFGGQNPRRARGRDVSLDIELSFREAIFGSERRVLVAKMGECNHCKGSGARPGSALISCAACNGRGEVREARNSFFGSITTSRPCPRCHGRGQVPEAPCESCKGLGITRREEEIHVVVPPGVADGEMIRMPGRGEAATGAPAGDLYVKLHVKPDPSYTREGNNLLTTLPIKLTDALLGASFTIRSIDGEIALEIPAGINHGELIRVSERGVPHGRGSRGDLLVRVEIQLPHKLSPTAKELIEKLRGEGL